MQSIKTRLFLSFISNEYSKRQLKHKCPKYVKYLIYKYFITDNWSKEQNLNIVEKNGYVLKFVKEQTEKICLKAFEQYGTLLKYVKDQTENVNFY